MCWNIVDVSACGCACEGANAAAVVELEDVILGRLLAQLLLELLCSNSQGKVKRFELQMRSGGGGRSAGLCVLCKLLPASLPVSHRAAALSVASPLPVPTPPYTTASNHYTSPSSAAPFPRSTTNSVLAAHVRACLSFALSLSSSLSVSLALSLALTAAVAPCASARNRRRRAVRRSVPSRLCVLRRRRAVVWCGVGADDSLCLLSACAKSWRAAACVCEGGRACGWCEWTSEREARALTSLRCAGRAAR